MPNTYRIEGMFNPSAQRRVVISEEDPKRLRRAFLDRHALSSLNKLVDGPTTSLADLHSVELAIRAIVFHDELNTIGHALIGFSTVPSITNRSKGLIGNFNISTYVWCR